MQELSMNEITAVSGGSRGDSAAGGSVAGGIAGGGAGAAIARAAGMGAMRGLGLGFAGIIGGAILFGAIAYVAYEMAE
jgi:hypothetical protein